MYTFYLLLCFLHQDLIGDPFQIDGLFDKSIGYQLFHFIFQGLIPLQVKSPHLLPLRGKFWVNVDEKPWDKYLSCLHAPNKYIQVFQWETYQFLFSFSFFPTHGGVSSLSFYSYLHLSDLQGIFPSDVTSSRLVFLVC